MAATNFAALNSQQKTVWSRDVWSAARDQMIVNKFLGTGDSALIQRITELTQDERGTQCLMQLVADLVGDGTINDNQREGNEEALVNYEQVIKIDLIANQVIETGKYATQASVINFREQAKNKLAYWLANRVDQLAMLTLSGISYGFNLDGSARVRSPFPSLKFAADVSAPTANRYRVWNGSALVAASNATITSAFVANYKMIVDMVAYAKTHYIKPLIAGGKEYYVIMVQPGTLAQLKKDQDYQRAVTSIATKDGANSPWFTGGTVTIDGAVIHEHRLVYTNFKAATKWGAGGDVTGTRTLLCGAQALGMADISTPSWTEKRFDFDTKAGISVDKMFGFLKPKFYSIYDRSVEDFGVLAVDHYLAA